MKRYVNEIANEYLRCYERNELTIEKARKITKIVSQCERGYITSLEAVRLIMQTAEGEADA